LTPIDPFARLDPLLSRAAIIPNRGVVG
jgi:hypothetical protein